MLVNHHVELTRDEIEAEKKRALEKVYNDELARLKSVGKKKCDVKLTDDSETLFMEEDF